MDYNMLKFILFCLGVFLFFFFKYRREDKINANRKIKEIESIASEEFSKPQSFGFKNPHGWMAVKTDEYLKVADFLSNSNKYRTNWEKGIQYAYDGGCFISPSIRGWTFVVSPGFFIDELFKRDALSNKLKEMSIEFDEVHCYTSYRIVSQNSWVKIVNGEIERAFSQNNQIYFNIGKITQVENELIIKEKKEFIKDMEQYGLVLPENELELLIDENHVFNVAKDWDINPLELDNITEIDERLGVFIYGQTIFD